MGKNCWKQKRSLYGPFLSLQLEDIRPTLEGETHRLNMELDLQSLFGLLVYSYIHILAETPQLPPSPYDVAHMRWHYWSLVTGQLT